MSASVLSPYQGVSIVSLSSPGLTFASPILNADRILSLSGGTWGVQDFLGGCDISFSSASGLVFQTPGVYELFSQVQGLVPGDLTNSANEGGLVHYFVSIGGASTQAKSSVYLPLPAVVGTPPLSPESEFIFTASGIVSVSAAGASIVPTMSFPPNGNNASAGGTCLDISPTATFIKVRRVA